MSFLLATGTGCPSKPRFELPATTDLNGIQAAADAGSRASSGTDAGTTQECDQADEGTPCGLPGRELHCIYNTCQRNVCGDGVKAGLEECDDGNQRDHDGCSSRCRKEAPPSCGDGVVDPGEACDDGNRVDTDACTNMCAYAVCGDAIVEAGVEECDDGNMLNSDACLDTCKRARCGDGEVGPGEQCDDGNAVNTDDCSNTCRSTKSGCGNGSVDAGEECDDGNSVNTDACTNACKNAVCGDGIVGPGEQCDDMNDADTDDCTNACKNAKCGDGIVWAGHEECDDGNMVNTDACTNTCNNAKCGDGVVFTGHEECDDGNTTDADACTNACKNAVCGDGIVFAGHEQCDEGANNSVAGSCTPSCMMRVVSALCGNAMSDAGEECDDGNTVNDDACSNACTLNACGNARLDPGEACDGTLAPSGALGFGKACAGDCKSIVDACLECEQQNCSDYMGTGIDLVRGCYTNPDPTKDLDTTLVQQCTDVITCARTSNCAYTPRGAEQCYCGDATSSQCASGSGINGPCKTQFENAAHSSDFTIVTKNFGNRKLPIGNAVFLLQCDAVSCGPGSATAPVSPCVPPQ